MMLRIALLTIMFTLFLGMGAVTIPAYTILAAPADQGGLELGPAQVTVVSCTFAAAPWLSLSLAGGMERKRATPRRMLTLFLVLSAAAVALMAVLLGSPHGREASSWTVTAAAAILFGGFNVLNQAAMAVLFATVLEVLGPDRNRFYSYRSAGTAGYIGAGLILGFGLVTISPQPLWLATAAYVGTACLCLVARLPEELAVAPGAPREVLSRFRARDELIRLLVLASAVAVVARFFDLICNPFLMNVPIVEHPSAMQMIAQSLEFWLLLTMPLWLDRFPHRWILVLGPLGWAWLYACMALSAGTRLAWPLVVGLPAQGLNCAFITCISIMISRRGGPSGAGRAQGLLIASQGAGNLAGSLCVGALSWTFGAQAWVSLWSAALVLAVGTTFLAVILQGRTTAE